MHVAGLGASLLKGCAPAHPDVLRLTGSGPVGDRRYCVVDLDARGGARVLRTVQNGPLLALRAAERDGVLTVTVPGRGPVTGRVPDEAAAPGRTVTAEYWGRPREVELLDGPWAAALGAHLGRPVALARARPRDVVYGGGVTLVTTSALAELARRARSAGHAGVPDPDDESALVADAERFRATAVLATGPDGDVGAFPEDGWCGRRLVLGDGPDAPVLAVSAPVARCAVVRMRPGDGRREAWDPLALLAPDRTRDTATGREVVMGVEAEVVRPGLLRVGAPVTVLPG
ncbi:hypothetical protein [Aquipuribacter sp. SD81]|uniref:hypothetical protein n=1 Tax=Aquipuribacter sp. SD81 TaxID=3127703 RepID=UPI003015EC4F